MPIKLRPYAKAILPAAATLVGVLGSVIATGQLDRVQLAAGVTGVLCASLTYLVSNGATVHLEAGEPPEGDTTTLGTPLAEIPPGPAYELPSGVEPAEPEPPEAV